MVISSRQKLQSLNDKTINVNVEGVKINQTDHSKALGLNIDGRNTYTQLQKRSRKGYVYTNVGRVALIF